MASPEAIKVLLPHASTGKTIPKYPISVVIDRNHTWYVVGQQVDEHTLKSTLLSHAKQHHHEVTVVLKADKDISVEQFIKVVDLVNQLKLPLVVATER